MPPIAIRWSADARRACQVGAVFCWGLGTMLVVMALITFFSAPEPGGRIMWTSLLAFPLYIVGSVLGRIGFMKSFSELAAAELVGATEATAGLVRRGMRGPWVATTSVSPTLRVRCRSCGFLEAEDATVCTSCRRAMGPTSH